MRFASGRKLDSQRPSTGLSEMHGANMPETNVIRSPANRRYVVGHVLWLAGGPR